MNIIHILISPCFFGWYYKVHPILRLLDLLFTCMWFLKFLSYHHIWHDVRYHVVLAYKMSSSKLSKSDVNGKESVPELKVHKDMTEDDLLVKMNLPKPILKSILNYPSNVSFKDILLFLVIPTLDFQLKYPFDHNINVKRFLLRLVEYACLLSVWVAIIMEYCTPLVYECAASFKREDYVGAFYYFIRLAAPNTY